MILLGATSDTLRLVTSATCALDVYAAFVDHAAGVGTPKAPQVTKITTATTTTIVAAPAAATVRNVKTLHVLNTHASTSVTVTVQFFNGTAACELAKILLLAGDALVYVENVGFTSGPGVPATSTTGSGAVVLATSPTLITPILGAATGTSLTASGNLTGAVVNATTSLQVNSVPISQTMVNVVFGWTIPASTTSYLALSGGGTNDSSSIAPFEADAVIAMTRSGTLSNLFVYLGGTQPASGSLVVTVRKNGVDQALTLTIPAGTLGGTQHSDVTHSCTYVAGDLISHKLVNNATAASGNIGAISIEGSIS